MPFSLTFQSIAEKIPAHGQEIMFFDTRVNGFGYQSGDLKEGKVYYQWDNGNGTSWVYDGEPEFVYDDGTKPEDDEGIHLVFCIEFEDQGFQYGPVSNIKEYLAKRIYWIDKEDFWKILPCDGELSNPLDNPSH